MNIETIKTLLDIRSSVKKYGGKISILDFGYFNFIKVWHTNDNGEATKHWALPRSLSLIINEYFIYDGEFDAWLHNKVDNIEFERELQRWLNLKAFI